MCQPVFSRALGLFLLFAVGHSAHASDLVPSALTCEYLINPMTVDVGKPRLSWINAPLNGAKGVVQSAFQIQVASTKELLHSGTADLWDSGKKRGNGSVNLVYSGAPLKSRQYCWWRVRVWDQDDQVSEWSDVSFWHMGILHAGEWRAKWIGAPWQGEKPLLKPRNPNAPAPDSLPPPAPMFRKQFVARKSVQQAVIYATGLGYFELYLNGAKVGDDHLVPNQTNYGKRPELRTQNIPLDDNFREYKVFYLAFDVTKQVSSGDNVLGGIVGNGFYNPAKYWADGYGTPRFLAQLHIRYSDGSEEIVATDETWKVAPSPIVMDMVYYGEHYDARLEQRGWCEAGFDDARWEYATGRVAPYGALRAHTSPTDKVMEALKPKSIEALGPGKYRIDFGEEISGWVRLQGMTGEAGRKIGIRYLHTVPNGANSYTLSGNSPESYAARFTWFVFSSVEIENWPGTLRESDITAEAVYTEVDQTATFTCSNPLFSDIVRIWQRSQKDNMHGGIASDCPNRERSPYTGDGQVACAMVMHNFDSRAFYRKWIADIVGSANAETGYVPNSSPWQSGSGGGPAWGAAIAIMPWEFYLHYGDTAVLREAYDGMRGYLRYMTTWTDDEGIMFSNVLKENGEPLRWFNLGEWNTPGELPPAALVHTFYLWHTADVTASVAKVLGRPDDAGRYAALAARTRQAFVKRFYNSSSGSFGPYGGNVLALQMGVPDDIKGKVVTALKSDIESNGGHLDTGIFGTRFFFEVLSANGLHDLAYGALNKRTAPSFGWWLGQGATTTWEAWHRPGSGNHPMFGGGLVWLYTRLAGMTYDPDQPGYRHVIFKPMPVADVTAISYSNLTSFGRCGIEWKRGDGTFRMTVTVPVGSRATVHVPCTDHRKVRVDGKPVRGNRYVSFLRMEKGYALFSVPSGTYEFVAQGI